MACVNLLTGNTARHTSMAIRRLLRPAPSTEYRCLLRVIMAALKSEIATHLAHAT